MFGGEKIPLQPEKVVEEEAKMPYEFLAEEMQALLTNEEYTAMDDEEFEQFATELDENSSGPEDPSRRNFLKRSAAVVASVAVGGAGIKIFKSDTEPYVSYEDQPHREPPNNLPVTEAGEEAAENAKLEALIEQESTVPGTLAEQLAHADCVDLSAANEAIRQKYYDFYTPTENSNRLEIPLARACEMGAGETFKELRNDYNVSSDEIHVLMALLLNESQFDKKAVSPSKAPGKVVGVSQFKIDAATEVGLTVTKNIDERLDPHEAIIGAYTYLARQMRMHNNDLFLGLSSYNAGGALFGYREVMRNNSTVEHSYEKFIELVEHEINIKLQKVKQNGYYDFSYTTKSGESLSVIAQKFNTTVDALKQDNDLYSDTIAVGQKIDVFFRGMNHAKETLQKKFEEALEYVPRIIAISNVLKEQDALKEIQETAGECMRAKAKNFGHNLSLAKVAEMQGYKKKSLIIENPHILNPSTPLDGNIQIYFPQKPSLAKKDRSGEVTI